MVTLSIQIRRICTEDQIQITCYIMNGTSIQIERIDRTDKYHISIEYADEYRNRINYTTSYYSCADNTRRALIVPTNTARASIVAYRKEVRGITQKGTIRPHCRAHIHTEDSIHTC